MLSDPISVTYNTVAKSLPRVNVDNNGADYFLNDGQQKFKLSIRHTIPARGQGGESHMVRLDVEEYDVDGTYLRTASAWSVLKTWDQAQDNDGVDYAGQALVDLLDDTMIGNIIQRQS